MHNYWTGVRSMKMTKKLSERRIRRGILILTVAYLHKAFIHVRGATWVMIVFMLNSFLMRIELLNHLF